MVIKDYARMLRRSWLWILLAAILGVTAAWAVTSTITPRYSATSAAFVSSDRGSTVNEICLLYTSPSPRD